MKDRVDTVAGPIVANATISMRTANNGPGELHLAHAPEKAAPVERVDTLIIGGGQAGLAMAYQLSRLGRPYLVVDAGERVGDVWRNRWDSLRLFTPARYNGLPGMPFPADPAYFATKDEMAAFLECYAERFDLRVRNGTRIEKLTRRGDHFVAISDSARFEAQNVIVAMSNYQKPRVPAFGRDLDPSIVQFHSLAYRSPRQLQQGDVLIVGAGNSGSEIAIELARRGFRTYMSGRDVGSLPFRVDGFASRVALGRLVLRFLFHRVLTIDTPIGRRARPHILTHGGPLIRVKPKALEKAGVTRVARVAGARDGRPVLEDGTVLNVSNVVWCTGFDPGFQWIDLPIFENSGYPRHRAGVVDEVPGLYFLGLLFLYSLSSSMVHGVERDSARIAKVINERSAHPARVSAGG